jgi:hypothetical protein
MSDPTCPSRSSRPTPERSTPPPTRRRRHRRYRESTPRSPIFSSNSGPARGSVSICTDFRRERIDCDPGGARGAGGVAPAPSGRSSRGRWCRTGTEVWLGAAGLAHRIPVNSEPATADAQAWSIVEWPHRRTRHRKRPPAPATVRLTTVSRSVPQRPRPLHPPCHLERPAPLSLDPPVRSGLFGRVT